MRLWDTVTSARLLDLAGHENGTRTVAFSGTGDALATGGSDGTILLWDVRESQANLPSLRRGLARADLDQLWENLAEKDVSRVFDAIQVLAANAEVSLPFLAERIARPQVYDPTEVRQLVADLDHDDFEVREKAERRLRALGEAPREELRRLLDAGHSPEVRARVTAVLDSLRIPFVSDPNGSIRTVRAMQVFERVGTQEAIAALEKITEISRSEIEKAEALAALRRIRGGSSHATEDRQR